MIAYVAHPVGPDGPERVANLERVRRWIRWLIDTRPDLALSIPWLPYCEVLDESPINRQRGIRDGIAMLDRCDAIVLVGGRMSPGMVDELRRAAMRGLKVIDLLHLGAEPPAG